jgi:hypothetical protein
MEGDMADTHGCKPTIVRASVSPDFEDGDTIGIFTEEMERLGRLKSDLLALNGAANTVK